MDPITVFDKERHVFFLQVMLDSLPAEYETQEINTLTLAYFAVSALKILDALDLVDKVQIVNWVLSFQAHPKDESELKNGMGSSMDFMGRKVLSTQMPIQSFMPTHIGAETDLRFVYCAAAICSMCDNWIGMDKGKAKDYIVQCQSYDGGFGLVPGSESHGGATYCAVAALQLMGFIEDDILNKFRPSSVINVPMLVEWSMQRQAADGGFNGRANKPSDTCYAFWVGGVLKMLGAYQLLDRVALRRFLLSCQSQYGGFTKFPENMLPELYHSYYGFSALSLLEEPGLNPLCVELGFPL
ncbi:geranylgeranyl transferase type-1 subunit beta isoform X4 [Asparagus officinalis]|uniref:geranylgeranyl transferase type-1 subunit beta isoform X4 n=1 Tax=Asparagus officinalis TaxID=4686 RepID=UPI00098E730A|nr:geranylgeranyl transferase type-1 subunit beta isoform X4 [Asparagus officinalis]